MSKRNISIPDDVEGFLTKLDNVSGYIAESVRWRWYAWQEALAMLQQRGWTAGDMETASNILNGYWVTRADQPGQVGQSVAKELLAAAPESAKLWGTVKTDESTARAVLIVARELKSGNTAISQRMGVA